MRLLTALEAGEAAGGQRTGRMSAALLAFGRAIYNHWPIALAALLLGLGGLALGGGRCLGLRAGRLGV